LPTYNPQMTHGHKRKTATRRDVKSECYGKAVKIAAYDSTSRYPRSVQIYARDKGNIHPTQKPLALMEYLVKTYSNEGEVVMDFAAGSFTTGVASIKNNRRFIGIEKEGKHFLDGSERVKQAITLKYNKG